MSENKYTLAGFISFVALAFAVLGFEASLLGLILTWFSVSLTFWQNFAIVLLLNMILK
jgi:hypothetical protein